MIEFERVTVFRGQNPVLNDLSFSIGQGERVAVIGGSGAGKTTLLKAIVGLLSPEKGKVIIDGEDVAQMSEKKLQKVRRKFSIVFQDGALFDSLNVKENVAFLLREYSRSSEREIEERVRCLLRNVGMEDTAMALMPEELSGGMRRRVAIARSMAMADPKMFLYDEPTADLDPVNTALIRQLILDLAGSDRGLIIVTHEMLSALKLAERFLFIKNGSLLFNGDKHALLNSPSREIRAFLQETEHVSPLEKESP